MIPLVLFASLLPLETGNHWVYRVDSRVATNQYLTRAVTGRREIAGVGYAVVAEGGLERLLREDEAGRIWEYDRGQQRLWLDPSADPDPRAALVIRNRNAADTVPAGSFTNLLIAESPGFETNAIYFAPDLGITRERAVLHAGSSGGFTRGLQLVYARIGGTRFHSAPDFTLSFSVDQTKVRLAPGEVTNCAVPCYFVACGFVPTTDPPGTFKPCLRARLTINNPGPPLAASDFRIVLGDATGAILSDRQISVTSIPTGATTLAYPVALYGSDRFPPGRYAIAAIFDSGHTATIPIEILP